MRGRSAVMVGAAVLVAPLIGAVAMPPAAVGATPPVSACFTAQDNGDPVLESLEITPREVDARSASQQVTFKVRASDTGGPGAASGVAKVVASVGFDEDDYNFQVDLTPTSVAGEYAGALTIHPHYRTATRFTAVSITDAADNTAWYSPATLDELGIANTFTTLTTPTDNDRPVVSGLDVSTRLLDTRRGARNLRLTVQATDAQGVGSIQAYLYGFYSSRPVSMRLVDGDAADGTWQGAIRVPRWAGVGTAKIGLEVTDLREDTWWFGARRLRNAGLPHNVRLVGRTDRSTPEAGVVVMSTTEVDVRAGAKQIAITAHLEDRGSGVRMARILMVHPDGEESVVGDLVRTSGTRHRGVWKATVEFGRCSRPGEWEAAVLMWDRVDGDYQLIPSVTVTNDDVERPLAEMVDESVRRSGPVSILFNENVVGVGAPNLLVRIGSGGNRRGDDGASLVDGTWSCTDAAGATVDCMAGPVRKASFTPTAALHRGTGYSVLLNPQHHLGLQDLAGNPAMPGYLSFGTD